MYLIFNLILLSICNHNITADYYYQIPKPTRIEVLESTVRKYACTLQLYFFIIYFSNMLGVNILLCEVLSYSCVEPLTLDNECKRTHEK